MRTKASGFGLSKVAVVLLMLAMLACCFTVIVSAETTQIQVDITDLKLDGLTYDDTAKQYYKVYDGKTEVALSVKASKTELGIAAADDVTVNATATFNSKNVGDAKYITVSFTLTGKDAAKYTAPKSFTVAASIRPKTLTWTKNGTAAIKYQIGTNSYTVAANDIKVPGTLSGVVSGDKVTAGAPTAAVVNGVMGAGTASTTVSVGLTGADAANYIAPLTVDVTVEKIVIDDILWDDVKVEYNYGDPAANNIKVYGVDKSTGKEYELVVKLPAGYGDVKEGGHQVEVALPDTANMAFAENTTANTKKTVVFHPIVITVSMPNSVVTGDKGVQSQATVFNMAVQGDIPADIRALISYTCNGEDFAGASDYGVYPIIAVLPDTDNYKFVDADGNEVDVLAASLTINKQYIAAANGDNAYQMILVGQGGFNSELVSATVSVPTDLSRKALRGFKLYEAYTLNVTGASDQIFTVLIPIADTLYGDRCAPLTANDIYVYEAATGAMIKASEKAGYTVSLEGGHYRVEGVSGSAKVTFVIAPEYNAPWYLTAPGIALIVLFILAVLALLLLIGLYLRRLRNTRENPVLIVDEGEEPEVQPVEVEDKVDADAFLNEAVENAAENAETEETPEENTEGVEEAVAETLEELKEEASEEVLEEDNTDPTEAIVEEKVEELEETTEAQASKTEADEDAVREAVDSAMEENLNESADATDAVVILAAEEEEDELTPEDFKAVVDAIVSDAMTRTVVIPEIEEATEEAPAEEATEAPAQTDSDLVVEEMSGENICAIVAESVAEAFELITVDGATPTAVEGTTEETIAQAVKEAGDANVPETWTAEMKEAVESAVTDELIERLLKAAQAFIAIDLSDDDDDDDNDDDDDDDENEGFGGFGSMSLTYIDIMAEPEKYAEMLEQERNGEVQLVYRYRRSFTSRMIQSQGGVQDYYNLIKNALLSYKGVKNRISWNYEAFNRGRVHVAKINAKTKTLYLYMALDPEELKDTKYGIVDVSAKKKYASIPVLLKIKGDRKFKYALELIDKLCGEQLQLQKMETEEVDYRIPYQTTDEMVESGVLKKLAAAIPLVQADETATEDAPATTPSAAAEAQEVTFIAPTDAPAVEAAAEEVAAEEAVAADNATEGESKEV